MKTKAAFYVQVFVEAEGIWHNLYSATTEGVAKMLLERELQSNIANQKFRYIAV